MNELQLQKIRPGQRLYQLAKNSYSTIFNNIMSKGKNKLKETFLGGNPITMEKRDFTTLLKKEYMVSTKADGFRFLMMVGEKSELEGGRYTFFVDRENNYWILTRNGINIPVSENIPPLLIDGELMFQGKIAMNDETILIKAQNRKNPLAVFSTFDILYGPTKPTFDGTTGVHMELILGSSGAFMGPKGGSRWPWYKRYTVLNDMILNEYSRFKTYIEELKTYNVYIVISPFLNTKDVFKNHKDPYKFMKSQFASHLKKQFPGIPKTMLSNTDGLIFTPRNTEYLRGPWDFCGNKVLKWKPSNELTIDFQLGPNRGDGLSEALVRDRDRVVPFVYQGVGVFIENNSNFLENSIVECRMVQPGLFEIKAERIDKEIPNAFKTAVSVMNAIEDPVDLSFMHAIYKHSLEKVTKAASKRNVPVFVRRIFNQIDKSFINRCYLKDNSQFIFNDDEKRNLIELIEETQILRMNGANAELEARIHFNSNRRYADCLAKKIAFHLETPIPTLKQFIKNQNYNAESSLRVSYALLGDKTKILEDEIEKETYSVLNIPPTTPMQLVGFDISGLKVQVSIEKEAINIQNHLQTELYRHQVRYEIDGMPYNNFSQNMSFVWRIDITEYGDSTRNASDAKKNFELHPRTNIELEYAPGDQENKHFAYYEDFPNEEILIDIVNRYNLSVTSYHPNIVRKALDERIKKLENLPADFIYRDFCRALYWVLENLFE